MENMDIFVKKEKKNNNSTKKNIKKYKILSREEIMSSIPENAKSEPDKELEKTHIEYRWQILKLPHMENEIIEMSHKVPNNERLYINKSGDWVKFNDEGKYDQFIIEKYYYYQEIQK